MFSSAFVELAPEVLERPHLPRFKLIGIGGAGCNTVKHTIEAGTEGINIIAVNTDIQTLDLNPAKIKLNIGLKITGGLGAGGNPEIGRQAAEESREEIEKLVRDTDILFIVAGMGGGTGTGAAPVVAEIASKLNCTTVAIVTTPFSFEGRPRMKIANEGLAKLMNVVDTYIVIPNEKLQADDIKNLNIKDAFAIADNVILNIIRGCVEIATKPGRINPDLNNLRSILSKGGKGLIGIGSASGSPEEGRAGKAAENAISSRLMEDIDISNSRSVLINITGNPETTTLAEVQTISELIYDRTKPSQDFGTGIVYDENAGDEIFVTVIVTGLPTAQRNIEQSIGTTNLQQRLSDSLDKVIDDTVISMKTKENVTQQAQIPALSVNQGNHTSVESTQVITPPTNTLLIPKEEEILLLSGISEPPRGVMDLNGDDYATPAYKRRKLAG